MRRIVTISFTGLDAGGGVPRWNRDFHGSFTDRDVVHYCWTDFPDHRAIDYLPEWEKARVLCRYLTRTQKITVDDVIVGDGFWADIENACFRRVVSVAHGIWSHLTKEDVDAGKSPEFPFHHAAQVKFRTGHLAKERPIVAVSEFIQREMSRQWGFRSEVINNAVDIGRFTPRACVDLHVLGHRLLIHGVTTENKGFDHIRAVAESGVIDDMDELMLLDDAAEKYKEHGDKYQVLAMASAVIQPSAYEGNSYFVLETLSCDVPLVAYPVGLLHTVSGRRDAYNAGVIISEPRCPAATVNGTRLLLEQLNAGERFNPRSIAAEYDISAFKSAWRTFIGGLE